ncbi:homoserine dehydrogenase [Eupransor demetentiae]|uniref:Homoserine dehydrogenase n=1 Tax=Eupransor demetentiae TaxID=3109584 RepID=A0ABM9N3R3_9LACO|nr:Homoserine dehydrogenase (ThrA) [Lactobacillaceae bacterium LMG 33000]
MTVKIGLLGLGTVGSGLVTILSEQAAKFQSQLGQSVSVKSALVHNLDKKRPGVPGTITLTDQVDDILTDPDIQIIVEVAGGIEPTDQWLKKALENGKAVVTANKDLIASKGQELIALAEEKQLPLRYEAAVAGGIPILTNLDNYYFSDQITGLAGIVNGTTNYILSQMANKGLAYETALKQAQELGFAESDPTNDVAGIDAAYKAIILARTVYGLDLTLEDFHIEGIEAITPFDIEALDQLKMTTKLLFEIRELDDRHYQVQVAPAALSKSNLLASIENETNAIAIESKNLGTSLFAGPGAGGRATAQAVLADIVAIIQGQKQALPSIQKDYQLKQPAKQAHVFVLAGTGNNFEKSDLVEEGSSFQAKDGRYYEAILTSALTAKQYSNFKAELSQKASLVKEFTCYS